MITNDSFLKILTSKAISQQPTPPFPLGREQALLAQDNLEEYGPVEEIVQDNIGTAWFIVYQDAEGNKSKRRISLKKISKSDGVIYIDSYCHERKAPRRFKLDKISEAVDIGTGEIFDKRDIILNHFTGMLRILNCDPTENSRTAIKDCQAGLNILAYLSRCDGQMHPDEEDVMMHWIGDQFFEYDLDDQVLLNHIRKLYPDQETYLDSLKKFHNFKSVDALTKFKNHALHLIEADGEITSEEAEGFTTLSKYKKKS